MSVLHTFSVVFQLIVEIRRVHTLKLNWKFKYKLKQKDIENSATQQNFF